MATYIAWSSVCVRSPGGAAADSHKAWICSETLGNAATHAQRR